jgi:hypothetical protein
MARRRNGKSSAISERIVGEIFGMFQIAEQGMKWAILQSYVFYSNR